MSTSERTFRPGRSTTAVLVVVALAIVVGLMSRIDTTMRDLPIPGTGVSGDTLTIRAEFGDALNLAVGAPVKVNGVDAGKVEEVRAKDFAAEATLVLRKDADVRQGALARLRYTTPLGELFVDVTNPAKGDVLADGAVLSQETTSTAPSVEDTLASASLLINGGGLDQLQTITEQLNLALNGNEGDYRELLDRATVFVTQANATTRDIDRVLTSLDSLSTTLAGRSDTINKLVRDIQPAAAVLRRNTPDFTRLLAEVEKFTRAANGTVTATRQQLLTVLTEIEPVLAEFAKNNTTFEESLQELIKGAKVADGVIATDYFNIGLNLHLDGIDTAGALEGSVKGLLGLLGLDPNSLSTGSLLNLGNLLGLGRTGTAASPAAARTTNPARSTGGAAAPKPAPTSAPSAGASDPLGITRLLGGLLGGGA